MKKTNIAAVVIIVLAMVIGIQYFTSQRGGSGNDAISREAIAFYQARNPEATDLTAKVINYGCHFEIEIAQQGRKVARLGWAGPGSYYVISN